ncbi:MAG: hypothetical protein IIC93_11840, partial [Chloroflexi bacterium]|nr:hypothetical protein [Chloroflexota bacterium]
MANTSILGKAAQGSGRRNLRPGRRGVIALAAAAGLVILLALLLARGDSPQEPPIDTGDATAPVDASVDLAPAEAAPRPLGQADFAELSMALTRFGIGVNESGIDVIYGHPALLGTAQAPDGIPDNALSFFVTENIHDEAFLLEKPIVYLSIDGSPRLGPLGATQTRDGV